MTTFSELELDARVLKAVSETGYETPTPIQEQAIPHALQGRDVLGIAQTGTGKTASFTLPMLTMLAKGRARARMPRSLVLAPTRELAAQVAENFETYAKHLRISMALLIGGTSFKDQDRLIDRGVDVLIATPGRLLDHFERGKLMLTGVQIMVVDEADRMLDMGFIPDIERIFKLTPFTRQTMFYSATMAPEITRITQEFLSNPVRVEVARQATTSETIEQVVCKHQPSRRDRADKEKREVLRLLIGAEGEKLTNGIIFCNRKRDVDVVAKSLKKHGFDAGPIHGDLDQSIRTRTLEGFRNNELRLLVASDVAARGLDIPSVSHVINFDVPTHSEDYVHRIGRTGRAGREGKSITLCLPHEQKYLDQIEELVKKSIPLIDSPLATEAPAPEAAVEDEKPARSRSRSRSRKPREDAPAPEMAEAPEPRRAPNRSQGSDDTRGRRGGGRGRGDNRSGGGPKVIGMGDHVPAFMTRDLRKSLEDAKLSAADIEDDLEEEAPEPIEEAPESTVVEADPPQEAAAEAPTEAAPQDEADAKPKRKPRARRSSKKAEAPTDPASEGAESPVAEPIAAQPDAAEPTLPKPETTATADPPPTEAETPEPAKKPRKRARTRASAADVIEEATPDPNAA
ncbi:MAG: DEAD/DEAH box helicase [Pseudomonadota bacterium]